MCFYCSYNGDDSWESFCQSCHEFFEQNSQEHLFYWKLTKMEEQFLCHKVIDPNLKSSF